MPKIGDTIWVWDENRRVYPEGSVGKPSIWREHWRPEIIWAETSRSWVIGSKYDQIKVPKKGANPMRFSFSQAEIDEKAYVAENRWKISDKIRGIDNADKLRRIEAILASD